MNGAPTSRSDVYRSEKAGSPVGPLVGQLHDAIEKTVNRVLQSDRFQPVWIELNRRAHEQADNGQKKITTKNRRLTGPAPSGMNVHARGLVLPGVQARLAGP